MKVRALARASSPRDNLARLDCEVVAGDLTDRPSLVTRDARRALSVPCRRRLPALGARSVGDPARQCRRHARPDAGSAGGRRRAHRLHQQRRHPRAWRAPTAPVDETAPLSPRTRRSAPTSAARSLAERRGRGHDRRDRLPAVIVNPSTPIGPRDIKPTPTGRIIVEAARGQDAGLRRYRPQPRRMSTTSPRAICWRFERGRIGERYILGGENVSLRDLLADDRRARRPQARRRIRLPRAPLYPLAFGAEAVARVTGKEPLLTRRRPAHVALPHVLHLGQGRARARLSQPRPTRRRWPTRSPGSAQAGYLTMIAGRSLVGVLALAIWLYLLLGRGGFWLARERDDRTSRRRPRAWPRVVGGRAGAQRGRRHRALDRQPAGAGLSRRRSASSWSTTQRRRHRRRGASRRARRDAGRLDVLRGAPLPAGLDRQAVGAAAGRRARRRVGRRRTICC